MHNTKILIYKTNGGGISCKITYNNYHPLVLPFLYNSGKGKCVRENQGVDKDKYPLIVSFSYLEGFLKYNEIDYENIEIDNNSIEMFYGYSIWDKEKGLKKEKYLANLSPAHVKEWWDYRVPDLYRYVINKTRQPNLLGKRLIYFKHKLVESGLYIAPDITIEEVRKLSRGHEDSYLVKEMWNVVLKKEDLYPKSQIYC